MKWQTLLLSNILNGGRYRIMKRYFVKATETVADDLFDAFIKGDCTLQRDFYMGCQINKFYKGHYFGFYNTVFNNYPIIGKQADSMSFLHNNMVLEQSTKASKTNQEAGFGANVVLLDDSTFEKVVNENKPTFAMFYATWCGHCSTVKPAYSRLATAFKTDNAQVNVIAIDAAENPKTADFANIQNLPTFKIFKSGKEIAMYEGDRSTEDMTSFIKSNV